MWPLEKHKYLVGIKSFEKVHRLLEVIDHFFLRRITGIALCPQGADACAVLVPLVFPELLVIALVVLPVRVHIIEEVGLAK